MYLYYKFMKIIYINIIALKSVKSFKNKCLDNYLKSQENLYKV